MTPPFEGDFSHAVGDARKRMTASSGSAQGSWRGECWKCGYDGSTPRHTCADDQPTVAGTSGVLSEAERGEVVCGAALFGWASVEIAEAQLLAVVERVVSEREKRLRDVIASAIAAPACCPPLEV